MLLMKFVCLCKKKFQDLRKKKDEIKVTKDPRRRKRRCRKKGTSDSTVDIHSWILFQHVFQLWTNIYISMKRYTVLSTVMIETKTIVLWCNLVATNL